MLWCCVEIAAANHPSAWARTKAIYEFHCGWNGWSAYRPLLALHMLWAFPTHRETMAYYAALEFDAKYPQPTQLTSHLV